MYENVTVDRSNYSITPRKSGNSYNNLINDGKITTSAGKRELISIIDSKDFAFPKPAELISYLLRVVNSGNAIVLDFFAGSGTTASSIFELNRTQTIKRRFIVATKKYDFFQKDNEF
jgi:adenine-specific DNA-methyltransferase